MKLHEITGSWFPVFEEQMLDEGFQSLTAVEKVYYWYLASEFNESMSKRFFRADVEFAAALGLAEITVRKARRKFEQLGLIKTTHGTRTRSGNLATVYHVVKWSHPDDYSRESRDVQVEKYTKLRRVPGLPFAKVHRHSFNVMLSRVRNGTFKHRDLVVWVILFHWFSSKSASRERLREGGDGSFRISKRQLVKDTGEPKAVESIKRLYDGFTFRDGPHLFEFEEKYHEVVVKSFSWCTDPSKDEGTYKRALSLREEIATRAQALKKTSLGTKGDHEPLAARAQVSG